MKSSFFLIVFSITCFALSAQVLISSDTLPPSPSAALEIRSSSRGFLPPRMTASQRDAIQNPALGLFIYNTTSRTIDFFDGISWDQLNYPYSFSVECGRDFVDSRDGQRYPTVPIGNQCWMAKNLNTGTRINSVTQADSMKNNGIIEKYCYDNQDSCCDVYGGLYQWKEMMQYAPPSAGIPGGVKGICPEGWHIPSVHEWDTLILFLGADSLLTSNQDSIAGGRLKHPDTLYWKSPNPTRLPSGFHARGSGIRTTYAWFTGIRENTIFWSSSAFYNDQYWIWSLEYETENATLGYLDNDYGFPVRCICDYYAPSAPSDPVPESGSNGASFNPCLSWECSHPEQDSLRYDIYFGEYSPPPLLVANHTQSSYCLPVSLGDATTCYWQVIAKDTRNRQMAGPVWSFTTFNCSGSVTDPRDSASYPVVRIGTQCWMSKNLNAGKQIPGVLTQTNNDTIEKYCYEDDTAHCSVYGGLYLWDEMMNYGLSASPNPAFHQGICPEGWHLPSDPEWDILSLYAGGSEISGDALKEADTIHWLPSPLSAATNWTGFTALPGGIRDDMGSSYSSLSYGCYFFSTVRHFINYYRKYYLYYNTPVFGYYDDYYEEGLSVRCLKD